MSESAKRLLIAAFFLILSFLCFYYTFQEGRFSYSITLPGILMLGIAFIFIRNARK